MASGLRKWEPARLLGYLGVWQALLPTQMATEEIAPPGCLEVAAGAAAGMPGGAVGAPACLYVGKGANTARDLQ